MGKGFQLDDVDAILESEFSCLAIFNIDGEQIEVKGILSDSFFSDDRVDEIAINDRVITFQIAKRQDFKVKEGLRLSIENENYNVIAPISLHSSTGIHTLFLSHVP